MNPRQSPSTHTEQLGDEASVYDWARAQVHALNPTAARVWRQCDGATSPDAIAAVLRRDIGIAEAEAVVDLTLKQLARVHLLELPVELRGDRSTPTRRWLLGRGVAAAMLPAIYSIVAPSPVDAQSLPVAAPTLTSLSPSQGSQGTTVPVTLTGTNFVVGATTVTISGAGVTANTVVVGSTTSLTANFVLDAAAATGARTVTVTSARGTSAPQTFTVSAAPLPAAPTLTSVTPNQGLRGTTVPVILTGTNFVVGATTVAVAGGGVTVNAVVVGSSTSLTANFVLSLNETGARTVTVTTAGGTSGPQTFTISLPSPGLRNFGYTGGQQTFTVPDGVVSVTIQAAGAAGAGGIGPLAGSGQLGGLVTATVPVTPGASLNVKVGGAGSNGGFNGGGGITGGGGRGGGASSVDDGVILLVVGGGGGGGGADAGAGPPTVSGGSGGAGGGLAANPGTAPVGDLAAGKGGTQTAGGAGGLGVTGFGTNGTAGVPGTGGTGGNHSGAVGGGGGGGGYFGGGGGGGGVMSILGGAGGGGGSSFTYPLATGVVHTQGGRAGNGEVTIAW